MNNHPNYTAGEDAVIRDLWPDVDAIAAQLDRSRLGVGVRGRKLGLPWRRPSIRRFTAAERQAVIDRYPNEGAKPLAREFGRTQADLVSFAQRLGVTCNLVRRWSRLDDERVVAMRRAGRSWVEIAAALGRTWSAVCKRAQDLGLTRLHYNPHERRRELINPRELKPLANEVRWAKARLAFGEHGWPPDLNPKEIAILGSLWAHGPQSRRNLATSIGEPAERNHKKLLMTHGGRSAMARLLARGLVARLPINNERKRVIVYTLTNAAVQARGTFPSVASFNSTIAAMRIQIPLPKQRKVKVAA